MSNLFLVLAVVVTWIAWFTGKHFWKKRRFFLASFVFLFWIIAIAVISVCRQQYI